MGLVSRFGNWSPITGHCVAGRRHHRSDQRVRSPVTGHRLCGLVETGHRMRDVGLLQRFDFFLIQVDRKRRYRVVQVIGLGCANDGRGDCGLG